MKLRHTLQIVLVLAVLLVPACGAKEEGPKGGGNVVIALPSEPKTLETISYSDIYTGAVVEQITDSFIRLDLENKPSTGKRALVESWENPDPTTYIFHLKKGVKFHDGKEFNAEDAKFYFESRADPAVASTLAAEFEIVDQVTIIDDYTIEVKLTKPFAPFLIVTCPLAVYPKHVVEEVGLEEFSRNPVGTGPYKFVSWESGNVIKLERNDDYWGDAPHIETIEFKFIPELSAGVIALKAGDIDFLYQVPEEELESLEQDPNIDTNAYAGLNFRFIAFNSAREPFDDVRVRQAINYAFDTGTIVDLWGVLATPATANIPPYLWAYTDDVKMYPRDVEKAKQLLAEAGYPDGFETTLTVPPESRNVEEAVLVQAQLAEVGIKLNIEQLEWGVVIDNMLAGEYDLMRMGWTGVVDPYDYFTLLDTDGDWNAWGYSNLELDKLLDDGVAVSDPSERKPYYVKAQQIVKEDVPFIFIFHEKRARAYKANLKGLTQWVESNSFGPLAQVSEWYWED